MSKNFGGFYPATIGCSNCDTTDEKKFSLLIVWVENYVGRIYNLMSKVEGEVARIALSASPQSLASAPNPAEIDLTFVVGEGDEAVTLDCATSNSVDGQLWLRTETIDDEPGISPVLWALAALSVGAASIGG